MILPDENTPAGTKCWVKDYDDQKWLERKFVGAYKSASWGLSYNWLVERSGIWVQCRLDDPYAKPVPHVHHDKIVQWAADPSLKVWRLRSDGVWILLEGQPLWRDYEKYHIGETPPPPEPRMITIEGHTFAVPSPVQTETYDFRLIKGPWIREQDVAAYLAAKDALMDRAIKEQLK